MEARDALLEVARSTDDQLAASGTRPEAMFGIITMVIAANGGEMDEEPLTLSARLLLAAAQTARVCGRQAIYEFVADTLVQMERGPQ